MTAPVVIKAMAECPAYRISPQDTNYFALVFDPEGDGADLTCVIEVFEKDGKTPPNVHARAHEMFFVLKGEGIARCGDVVAPLKPGDAMLLRPGNTHVVENTGPGKLYTLTIQVPNDEFAELIRRGTRVQLDEEDKAVIAGLQLAR
jgi:mannose-6-phosphate isomerase-like protein (cupin superfamily)